MNDNAKAWVKALRSGEYKQIQGRLRVGDAFCCLGVACNLFSKTNTKANWVWGPDEYNNNVDTYHFLGTTSVLPASVREWLGLNTLHGDLRTLSGSSLVSLNDDEMFTFDQIADEIEANEKSLFVNE